MQIPRAFFCVLLAGAGAAPPAAQTPAGCYHFDRPLGSSASGALERDDSTFYTLELLPDSTVSLPALQSSYWRAQYAHASRWRIQGDTLVVRISTGLVGWDLALVPRERRWVGTARYLSDAIGGPPIVVPVHAAAESCLRFRR